MLWLTWRQHRAQILITAGLLAGLGIILLIHGLGNADLVSRFSANHDALVRILGQRYQTVVSVTDWFPLAPAAVGLFWGAPVLAREFERGTHKLAWTQSVPRARWLAVKLGGLAAAVTVAGLAAGLIISAWVSSFAGTEFAGRFNGPMFVLTGVVPAAWWLFAFAVGVAAGAAFRRTLPAIAVTLVVVAGTMILSYVFDVREAYAEPERVMATQQQEIELMESGAMLVDVRFVNAAGEEIPMEQALSSCVPLPEAPCGQDPDLQRVILYHPASRYWQFQWTETGILVAAALLAGGVAVHRASRRVV